MEASKEATARAAATDGAVAPALADLEHHPSDANADEPNDGSEEKASPAARAGTGHSLSSHGKRFKPEHSGASVVTFFTGVFQTVLGIATLGASISFSYVLSNTSQPTATEANFTAQQVQLFLSISWLLFLLALAFASLGSTLLTFFRKPWQRDWDGLGGPARQLRVQLYAVGASAIMGSLLIAAFCFLCLVVVAYSSVVGWIALGFTGLFGIIISVAIMNQVPWNGPGSISQKIKDRAA